MKGTVPALVPEVLNVKNPLGGVSYNKIKGEIDAALAFHLSIFPHARRLPAYPTAAAKLQTAWAKIVRTRRRLTPCANRVFGLSSVLPVQLRFRSPAARMPHVVISYLPSVARKYTLAVLGAVPRCNPGRAYADIVHRQNGGFPSREGGFDSHYPLQGRTKRPTWIAKPPECV